MAMLGVSSGNFRKGSIQSKQLQHAKRSGDHNQALAADVFALLIYFCYDLPIQVYRALSVSWMAFLLLGPMKHIHEMLHSTFGPWTGSSFKKLYLEHSLRPFVLGGSG